LRLRLLGLTDVRNYAELSLEVPAGLVVFIGRNAQGKSNILEAIGVLATGKSFRTAREGELIRQGAERAVLSGEALVAAGTIHLGCEIVRSPQGARKTYRLNGEPTKFARYLGSVRAVTFTPADLELVDGPPSTRRAMLNSTLSQSDPRYYRELALYTKILAQKRAVLRAAGTVDRTLLATYNAQLAGAGEGLVAARTEYTAVFSRAVEAAHRALRIDGTLHVTYRPSVPPGGLAARLQERTPLEITSKSALVGPHRDDVELLLDGVSLAAFGSQGQKRGAVLALKLAEYAVLREQSGEAPLLLLDDVLSELDDTRQRAFIENIAPFEQVFLTATVLPQSVHAPSHAYRVEAGRVEQLAC
jgi:DNA replication and repair protein RecF